MQLPPSPAIGVAVALLALGAGLAVALRCGPEPEEAGPLDALLVATGWAFGLIPLFAFAVALVGRLALTPGLIAAVAAAVVAAALMRRPGRPPLAPASLAGWHDALPVLLAAAAVAVLYALKYDRSAYFADSCLHRSVRYALHPGSPPVDLLRGNIEDQRLGNPAVVSAWAALFGTFGLRLCYAAIGWCAALGGWVLGRRVLGGAVWGWFVLVALPLNPWVAKLPLLDENLLAMAVLSLALPLAMRRRVPWVHVGLLVGLAGMMRHTLGLAAPALLWLAWRGGCDAPGARRWRTPAALFVGLGAATSLGHLHHLLAFGSPLRFESTAQFARAFPHRLIGDFHGLWQWPLYEAVVRTPWNPFPTFVMWPLELVGHFGLLATGALLVGLPAMCRCGAPVARRTAGFWFAWLLPTWAVLSLQENWDVPNKMGVAYTMMHPLVLWTAAGLRAAIRDRRFRIGLLATALCVGPGTRAMRSWKAPADPRYVVLHPRERPEDPIFVAARRELATAAPLLPDYGRLADAVALWDSRKPADLWASLGDRRLDGARTPYGFFPTERGDPDTPVIVELDLRRPLTTGPGPPLRVLEAEARVDLDLVASPGDRIVPNLRLPGTDRPATLFVSARRGRPTVLVLGFVRWEPGKAGLSRLRGWTRSLTMLAGWRPEELEALRPVRAAGPVLHLRVPEGPLSLAEILNNAGQLYLVWRAELTPGGALAARGPFLAVHN